MVSIGFFSRFGKFLGMVSRLRKLRSTRKRKQTRKRRCRIADLPDCILESILSLIPLRDAVETSLVCRDWRPFLLKRRNLVFDFEGYVRRPPQFVKRVDTYLQLYKGNKVDSFTVDFTDQEGGDVLDRWIRFAITKGVEELHLRHHVFDYVFPHRLLSEQVNAGSRVNLKVLSICSIDGILRPPPDFNGFNQLKTLHLIHAIIDPSFTSNLFSVFASLESLTLYCCRLGRYLANTRTDLDIVAGDRLTELIVMDCGPAKIKISARNLASLEYINNNWTSLSIKTPRLARIYLPDTVHDPLLPHVLTQFATCSELESLCLRMYPETLINFSMPAFGNLRKLKVDICIQYGRPYNDDNLLRFLDFLKAAPVLEELVTALIDLKFTDTTDEREIRNVSGFTHDNLKLVKMKSFHGHRSEIEFAICILKYTTNLKIMEIGPFARSVSGDYFREKVNYPERHRAIIKEKIKEVKTDAQIIFLS
ncbi:putative F-box/FBD/LRR-repeat protein [Rosa sericea]